VLIGPNVFARLHKWATRQDENFLTEALAVVLEHLLVLVPPAGVRLIHGLTDGFIDVPASSASAIELQPQVETGEGRPDLEVRALHQLVWVEVKAESDLRTGQLEGYRKLLRTSGFEQTRLVLLTRYPAEYPPSAERPDLEIRWFQVADWLETELPVMQTAGEVPLFLVQQFLDFFRARGMTLTQVSKYMPDGLRALSSFINMLFEAAAACKVSARSSPGKKDTGIYVDSRRYWLGIDYDDPEKLWFMTAYCRIDPEAAARLAVGEVWEEPWVPGRACWGRELLLDSEDVHFFSRNKISQLECLERFVRECLEMARSIQTPNQPPIPDEPEEA
jgi:hypothetical protein